MKKYDPDNPTKPCKAAAQMPPLHHQLPNQPFDIAKSEVINWLVQQPDIRQALFGHYQSKEAIIFDKETGTWKGREYKE